VASCHSPKSPRAKSFRRRQMRIKGVEIASCASQLGTIVQPTNANLNVNVRSMLSVFCINAYYNAVSNVAHA
jgi:hypothetical protein